MYLFTLCPYELVKYRSVSMKKIISYVVVGLFILLIAAQIGCVSAANTTPVELTIFAAASLTGVMGDLEPVFEAAHPGVNVISNLESSSTLETQIKEGAYADVYLPASTKNMDNLEKEGLITNASVTPYAINKLAIIVPKDNPAKIEGLADLAKPGVKMVSETAEVPVRRYTEQMLNKTLEDPEYGSTFVDAFRANVISEETNVAGAAAKVSLGEADVGITYYSDVTKGIADKVTIIEIPEKFNVVASYKAGVLKESKQPELSKEFITLLTSDDGKKILEEYKFSPV
ncbi:MAG: molybdate ABC transporter substrate-binding protein [Methanomicrobiales archaeon HGW-Methanomicrobiales-4]|nr:MAG: molybdate ABC transporter substrate-binding protein [Methanomicrobiales archaeon HGW-Methanomicrobiales-4]